MRGFFVAMLLCLAACEGRAPLTCYGPDNCSGNPCCFQLNPNYSTTVYCTSAATSCQPGGTADRSLLTRMCHVDADCTAGISTSHSKCCAATVESQKARTCNLPSNCGIGGSSPDDDSVE